MLGRFSLICSLDHPLLSYLSDAGAAAAFLHAASVWEADPAPAAGGHTSEQPRVDLEAARGQAEAVPGGHHPKHLLRPGLVPPEAEPDRSLARHAVPAVLLAHGVSLARVLDPRPSSQSGASPWWLEPTAESETIVKGIVSRYCVDLSSHLLFPCLRCQETLCSFGQGLEHIHLKAASEKGFVINKMFIACFWSWSILLMASWSSLPSTWARSQNLSGCL